MNFNWIHDQDSIAIESGRTPLEFERLEEEDKIRIMASIRLDRLVDYVRSRWSERRLARGDQSKVVKANDLFAELDFGALPGEPI